MDEKMKQILANVRAGNADSAIISYDSEDLIAEVEEDIKVFGAAFEVYVWAKYYPEYNKSFVVNYDFISVEPPTDIEENEAIGIATLGDLLAQLKKQNSMFGDD